MKHNQELKKELERAKQLGIFLAHWTPDEFRKFRELIIRSKTELNKLYKDYLDSGVSRNIEKEKEIKEEEAMRGDIPKVMAEENIWRSILMLILLLLSVIGEFDLVKWTIQPFGLGAVETIFLAIMILIFTLEGMNYTLTIFRKKYPAFQENLFLILGVASIILIILIILFGASIRAQLFHMSTLQDLSLSPEETIKGAENFYRETSGNFMVLMACLSLAVLVVGGLSWHDLRNRFFSSISLWKLHKSYERVKNETQDLREAGIEEDMDLLKFLFELDSAYICEKMIYSEEGAPSQSLSSRLKSLEVGKHFWKIVGLIILLILAVIVFFFGFRGVAKGETVIFLDLSQSMAASDYTGKVTEFQKNVGGIEAYLTHISPGKDVKIIGVTERTFSSQYVLLEGKITDKKGAFGQGAARDKVKLLNSWKGVKLEPKAPGTDLFGAMQLAEIIFTKNSGNNELIFFSDMRQFGQGFNFEAPQILDANSLLKEVTEKNLVPSLDGALVWCLGVHNNGKTPSYWKSLREFWRLYFQQARAKELKAFTPERRIKNE